MSTSQQPLLAYFGHHKCASSWIRAMLADVCAETNLRSTHISRADELSITDLGAWVAHHQAEMLLYSNADIEQVRLLGPMRGFHVVRDPRDLIVSAYFSHLYSHRLDYWPQLAEHRKRLEAVNKTEGLLLEIDFSRHPLADMYAWDYAQPNVLEVRMEDLILSPYEKMAEIMMFLGLTRPSDKRIDYREQLLTLFTAANGSLQRAGYAFARNLVARPTTPEKPAPVTAESKPPPTREQRRLGFLKKLRFKRRSLDLANLLQIVYRHRFSSKAEGRRPGQEDTQSHYRKGVSGDWVNHFEPVHIEYFKQTYNDILLKLGYETSPDWK